MPNLIIRFGTCKVRRLNWALGVHSLRIKTGQYLNSGVPIPVERRKCLVCKENYMEDEQHFFDVL